MKAVAYCRYSSEMQRDGYSIEGQTSAIKKYCEDKKITLLDFYIDEAQSATSDNRESFQRLMKDAQARRFDMLIVHKSDRLFRNRYDAAIYKKRLRDCGVTIVSVLEPMLDGSPESIMIESMLDGMAEYYSANLAREIMKGTLEAAKRCLFVGGSRPLGYDIVNQHYVVNEAEAVAVRLIFDLYLNGYNKHAIAAKLADLGYKSTAGNPISPASLHAILKNPIYKGTYVYGSRSSKKENYIEIPGGVPAILTADVFDKVANMRASASLAYSRARQRHEGERFILTGRLYCPFGHRICGNSKKAGSIKKSNYRCSRKKTGDCLSCHKTQNMNQEILEAAVLDVIEKSLLSVKSIDSIVDRLEKIINANSDKAKKDADQINREIEKIKNRQAKLLDIYLDGSLSKDVFNKKSRELASELMRLEDEKAQIKKLSTTGYDKEKIRTALRSVIASNNDSEEYKTKLINAFLDHAVIYSDRVEMFFKFPIVGDAFDISSPAQDSSMPLVYNREHGLARFTLYTSVPRAPYNGFVPDYLKNVSFSVCQSDF